MGEVFGGLDATAVAGLIQQYMPKPATTAPLAESTTAAAGTDPTKFSQDGHQHPRLTSATYSTSGSDGKFVATFTRSFTKAPCPVFSVINITGCDVTVLSWVQDANSNYIGANCIVTKRTAASSLTNAVVALVSVVTGVTTTTTDAPVASALTSCVFLAQSS